VGNVIEARGLTKDFGAIRAVDGIRSHRGGGEMFGLVGAGRCGGKQQRSGCLCGILAPTNGGAMILGKNIVTEPDLVKKDIGYLSQDSSLLRGSERR